MNAQANQYWLKPYTVASAGWWLFKRYYIVYEDTPLRFVAESDDYDTIKRIVGALNGAYNLGRYDKKARDDAG